MEVKDLSTLKIHKLSQAQYDREAAAGNLDDTAIYLTPDEGSSGGGQAIIDVLELPTENIDERVLYRLMTSKFVYNKNKVDGFSCYIVNNLPEVGDPVSTDMQTVLAYYNIADGDAYGYVDSTLGASAGVPAGWYTLTALAPMFNVSWRGVIADIDDDPSDDSVRLLLCYEYYIYQDDWCQIALGYEKPPKINIQWDGNMDGHAALDMSMLGYNQGEYFVKVSDDVLTTDEVIGGTMISRWLNGDVYKTVIEESTIDTMTYPGAFIINNMVVVMHDEAALASALGISSGVYTNGVYFYLYTEEGYVSRFTSPARITKIDEKFLPVVDADSLGLSTVAKTGNYNDLWNKPTIYTDVIRYNTTQNLGSAYKSKARTNIDVYSKSEVDTKIANVNVNLDLASYAKISDLDKYAKTSDVEVMIAEAIGTAIGGSY